MGPEKKKCSFLWQKFLYFVLYVPALDRVLQKKRKNEKMKNENYIPGTWKFFSFRLSASNKKC